MQLTIDIDKNLIERLKEEFHTSDLKDAVYQLLDSYKQTNTTQNSVDVEIEKRVEQYKNGSLPTTTFDDGLKEMRKGIVAKL